MVETEIATYLENNTSLVKGTSLFLSELPDETRTGVVIREIRSSVRNPALDEDNVVIIIFKRSYPAARALALSIRALMDSRRGTMAEGESHWSVRGDVKTANYGKDSLDRYTFVVFATIVYT